MSILSGLEIRDAMALGAITIDPFRESYVNSASVDLTLGRGVCSYSLLGMVRPSLDAAIEPRTSRWTIPKEGFVMRPCELYLLHTAERVSTTSYVPVLDGKSSIGRLGIQVHLTAGFGDPGFDGQYTLEVTTIYPVRVYAGMRIAQMRFHTIVGAVVDYRKSGHYVGVASAGAVPSMAWKQLREDGIGPATSAASGGPRTPD